LFVTFHRHVEFLAIGYGETQMPRSKNYLRMYRKRLGVNQRQLASILGLKSWTRISDMELGQELPTLRECIAFQVIFKRSPQQMWQSVAMEVEKATHENIRELASQLDSRRFRSLQRTVLQETIYKNLSAIGADFPGNDLNENT